MSISKNSIVKKKDTKNQRTRGKLNSKQNDKNEIVWNLQMTDKNQVDSNSTDEINKGN